MWTDGAPDSNCSVNRREWSTWEGDLEMTVKRIYQSGCEGFKRGGVMDGRKSRKYSEDSGKLLPVALTQAYGVWINEETL